MKEAGVWDIVLWGGGGGLLYWAFLLLRGGQPAASVAVVAPSAWLWMSLGLTVIVGAGAAFLMVFLAAATNRKEHVRAIAFAVACGFCWEPVLSGLLTGFTKEFSDGAAQNLVSVAQGMTFGSPGTAEVEKAADIAARLVESSPDVQNPVLRKQVDEQTATLLERIHAEPNVAARTEALEKVGVAAAESQQAAVLAEIVRSLRDIEVTQPTQTRRINDALKAIDRAAPPPRTRRPR